MAGAIKIFMRETLEKQKLQHTKITEGQTSFAAMDVAKMKQSRSAANLSELDRRLQKIVDEFPGLKNRIVSRGFVAADGTVAVMVGQESKRISLDSLEKMGKLLSRG